MSEFSDTARAYHAAAGLTLRELARRTHYDPGGLSKVLSGRRPPSADMAACLDDALDAEGQLAAIAPARGPGHGEGRLRYVAQHPRRIDRATVDTLAALLAHSRRLEDTLGSEPMIASTIAQLTTIETLAQEATEPVRRPLIDVAGQWAHFAGWLHTSSGRVQAGEEYYARALWWAAESGNQDLLSEVLSMKGQLAWSLGRIGPTVGLSQAAQRDSGVFAGQHAISAAQEARGHAMAGNYEATDRKLADAEACRMIAERHAEDSPPWLYYHSPGFFDLQSGLAHRYLGHDHPDRNELAIELLTSGLDALDEQERASEWAADYLYQLALAYIQAATPDLAARAARDITGTAHKTGSTRLTRQARTLHTRLRTHWPSHPDVTELGRHLHPN